VIGLPKTDLGLHPARNLYLVTPLEQSPKRAKVIVERHFIDAANFPSPLFEVGDVEAVYLADVG